MGVWGAARREGGINRTLETVKRSTSVFEISFFFLKYLSYIYIFFSYFFFLGVPFQPITGHELGNGRGTRMWVRHGTPLGNGTEASGHYSRQRIPPSVTLWLFFIFNFQPPPFFWGN